MALHHRRFLLPNPDKPHKEDASSCYMCYYCPDDCYISPPALTPPPPPLLQPPPSQKHDLPTILILMLCVLGASFLFLSYLIIYRYWSTSSRRRNSLRNDNTGQDFMDENHGPVLNHPVWYIRTIGLSQSIIDSITAFKFKKGDGLIEGSECSVCLSDFQEDEILRLLPKCSHAFHVDCIDTWLRSHKNCPICRAPIVIDNGNSVNLSSVEVSSSDRGLVDDNREPQEAEADENSSQTRPQGNEMVLGSRCVDNERKDKFRVLSDLGDRRAKVDQDLEVSKRSVSMDLSFSSMIYTRKDEGCSGHNLEKVEELISLDMVSKRKWLAKSYSHGRSIQKGPVSMKRSFSFTGKRSLRKNSKSLESISIPELSIS